MNKFILLTAVLGRIISGQIFNIEEVDWASLGEPEYLKNLECSDDTSEDMMKCVESMDFLTHPLTGNAKNKVETVEELRAVCNEMNESKICMALVNLECGFRDPPSDVLAKTVVGVVDYMCSAENADVILKNKDCWNNKGMDAAFAKCGNPSADSNDPCSVFTTMRSCVRNEVQGFCNNAATDFLDGFLDRSLTPTANGMFDCNLKKRMARRVWRSRWMPLPRN